MRNTKAVDQKTKPYPKAIANQPVHTGPRTCPIRVAPDTTPKTAFRSSGATPFAIYVFAIGMTRPIPMPVIARKHPKDHTSGMKYCKRNVTPAKSVDTTNTFFMGNKSVNLLTLREQSALIPPARKMMTPTTVAKIFSSTPIFSLMYKGKIGPIPVMPKLHKNCIPAINRTIGIRAYRRIASHADISFFFPVSFLISGMKMSKPAKQRNETAAKKMKGAR